MFFRQVPVVDTPIALKRRHLNESQRAMIAAKLANMEQGERTDFAPIGAKLSQPEAAKMLNVSRRSVPYGTGSVTRS